MNHEATVSSPLLPQATKIEQVLDVYLRELRLKIQHDDPTASPVSTNVVARKSGLQSSSIWRVVGSSDDGNGVCKGRDRLVRLAHDRSWSALYEFIAARSIVESESSVEDKLVLQLAAPIAAVGDADPLPTGLVIGDALGLIAVAERRPEILAKERDQLDGPDARAEGCAFLETVDKRRTLTQAWLSQLETLGVDRRLGETSEETLQRLLVNFALLSLQQLRSGLLWQEDELSPAIRRSIIWASEKPGQVAIS